jgi:DNA/RNA endonuclease G (NUC1)
MRFPTARLALCVFVLGAGVLSCKDSPTSVKVPFAPSLDVTTATAALVRPQLVISQIYGGGGNSGATLKNDFIELFNPGTQSVSTKGWSVQYASAAGTSWQVTALSGSTIPAGGYYLIQEAAGTGGTTVLPTPDASGTIAMSATGGKVALVTGATALSGACPAAVDLVSYGAAATDCGRKTTPTLANATAALLGDGGCAYTGDLSKDFASGTPAPRNSLVPAHSTCPLLASVGPLDTLILAGPPTLAVGSSTQITATPQDANTATVTDATISGWTSSDPTVATVDGTGKVTAVATGTTPVTITASAQEGNITKTGAFTITITSPAIKWIDVSSSSTSFPPGFQTQLFTTARTASGGTIIDATFKFESLDPDIATITEYENTGMITGISAPNGNTKPRLRIIATPKIDNGTPPDTFVTTSITIEAPGVSSPSIYSKNDEFGDPTAAAKENPNDLLIVRPQYTLSYNESRGTPNWVAYELDARHIVPGQDRCNCFTADPNLPADKQILTADYTNGGYDRGHMARSFDRTTSNLDNAATFYLTNIVPQQADLNQGVWAQFENALGDSATKGGRAVYIITGPLYSRSHGLTFLKGETKVAVPDSTWKIALVGPRNGGTPFGVGNVQSWSDLDGITVLAVNMPNVPGVRNDPWSKYLTTTARIEQATGYKFFTLLNTALRGALEVGDRAPSALYTVNGTALEGSAITFDGSSSGDVDMGRDDLGRTESLSYTWQFSDGGTATGKTATHTFAKYGNYTATLTVTDAFGRPNSLSQTLTVSDVAPIVSALPDAHLIAGETYSAAGSFTDPGVETWSATVNYGGGSEMLQLVDTSFAVAHTYTSAGTYTVKVIVSDDGGASGSVSAPVTVITPLDAVQALEQQLQGLAQSGTVMQAAALAGAPAAAASQNVRPLLASLDAAAKQIQRGNNIPAVNELGAFVNKLNAEVISGRMAPDAAQQMTAMVVRIQHVLGG